MQIKIIMWITSGILGSITIGLAQQYHHSALKGAHASDQTVNHQAIDHVEVQYVGQIPKDFSYKPQYVNVFRVTIPRTFAQIRMNSDNPAGHAPWYTDVYLNQIQIDDQHYLGRLYNNAGIQTAIDNDQISPDRFGKLGQPVYTPNQFYFTYDGVPDRIILLGQSDPSALTNLKKQYQQQKTTPFVWSIAVDPSIIATAVDDPCANANDCTLALNHVSSDQPASVVNNGADPWAFNVTIKQTLSGKDFDPSSQTGKQAYQHIVFYDASSLLTAESLITNLHQPNEQNGQYRAFINILPSTVANIGQDIYGNTPIYGRYSTQDTAHHQGYNLYTTDQEASITFKAALLEGRNASSVQTKTLEIQKLGTISDLMTRTLQARFDATSRKNIFSKDQAPAHQFTTFQPEKKYGPISLANPETNFPNYLVFNDGVYLYDNTTMGTCDKGSKKSPLSYMDPKRFFCQDHANYQWGWFSWDVNRQNRKALDAIYISDWQFLHPSDCKGRYIRQSTNYGNSKLAFDIYGLPYIWMPESPSGPAVRNHRHNAIDEQVFDSTEGIVPITITNDTPFDLMFLLRRRYGGFPITGPDIHSGFISPSGSSYVMILEDRDYDYNKKYDLFSSVNGVYLPLGQLVLHPHIIIKSGGHYATEYLAIGKGDNTTSFSQKSPFVTVGNQRSFSREGGAAHGDIRFYNTDFQIKSKLAHPVMTVFNSSGQTVDFQLTDGASQSFEQVYSNQIDLAQDQAKVIGVFKKDQPKNQQALHFKADGMQGSINFKEGQNPTCFLANTYDGCVVIEQKDTYPTTYLLDIQTHGKGD